MALLEVARQQRGGDRNPDRRAERTKQVEQARPFGAQGRRQRGKGHGAERNETQAHPHALDEPRNDEVRRAHLKRPSRHLPERHRRQQEADHHHLARVEPSPQQDTRQLHADQRADPARHQRPSGIDHRIAEQALQHRRQQGHRRKHHHAQRNHEEHRDHEVAVGKQRVVEQRLPGGGGKVNRAHPHGADQSRSINPDFNRIEPVEMVTAIQHELQRGNRNCDHGKAEHIEAAAVDRA